MKIALAIEYNGAAFHGWQSQPDGDTVQDAVQQALGAVAQQRIIVHAAGRTDSGVHATLMPAHFNSDALRQPSAWVRGGNALLPAGITLLWAKPVAAEFHARHRARWRNYQYIVLNRAEPPGLLANIVGHCHVPLDVAAMRRAAATLRGEHDFSAFRASSCQSISPVRMLHHLRISKNGDYIVFDFCGNGFLHHMVRNIVGTLLQIGRGRQPPQWARALLAGRDRTAAAPTAPAAGLYFNGAHYDACFKLPPTLRPAPIAGRQTTLAAAKTPPTPPPQAEGRATQT